MLQLLNNWITLLITWKYSQNCYFSLLLLFSYLLLFRYLLLATTCYYSATCYLLLLATIQLLATTCYYSVTCYYLLLLDSCYYLLLLDSCYYLLLLSYLILATIFFIKGRPRLAGLAVTSAGGVRLPTHDIKSKIEIFLKFWYQIT